MLVFVRLVHRQHPILAQAVLLRQQRSQSPKTRPQKRLSKYVWRNIQEVAVADVNIQRRFY